MNLEDGGVFIYNFCENNLKKCQNQSTLLTYSKGEDCIPLSNSVNESNFSKLISIILFK